VDLRGRFAVVTAGHVRVGRAIARSLARAGANIALTYRSDPQSAEAARGEFEALGVQVRSFQCELGNAREVDALGNSLEALEPAVLVNNASAYPMTPLGQVTVEAWDSLFAINLRAPFFLSQRIGLGMKQRGRGKIVNIGDWTGLKPPKMRGYSPYMLTKAGLIHMTRTLALELAPAVQVNCVCPGAVLLPVDTDARERKAIERATPLGRIGGPEDIAAAVMLTVTGTDFMTGSILSVDGGRLIA
jgi:NAD(P)-dependent dehydrogenase (short-subunit alcohol dehydrogenase family)